MRSPEVRPFAAADIDAAAATTAAAFDHDVANDEEWQQWRERIAHALETDPDGCFVAERDGEVLGVAQAIVRERLWCLTMLAVRPGSQSAGAGRALLGRALEYRNGSDAGLIVSSNDPRAMRLYGLAGFSLRPTFEATGDVDRRALPRPDPAIVESDGDELEELADIARAVRGAPYTPELAFTLGRGLRLLRHGDRGFAVASESRGVWMLLARDEAAASALLWNGLALVEAAARPVARWVTGGQDWAIEILLKAGLQLRPAGALCVRGDPGPLHPFIPSPPFA
ncbi:MAG TPA: GNAT family N-acetyltransferase [Solirubrobacteraceae bacterium]|jgi:ribosomal protein S18 acetylase RimI-like enzyme